MAMKRAEVLERIHTIAEGARRDYMPCDERTYSEEDLDIMLRNGPDILLERLNGLQDALLSVLQTCRQGKR